MFRVLPPPIFGVLRILFGCQLVVLSGCRALVRGMKAGWAYLPADIEPFDDDDADPGRHRRDVAGIDVSH